MSAIDDLFKRLRQENRKALMPFVTAGDPDLDFTAAVIKSEEVGDRRLEVRGKAS